MSIVEIGRSGCALSIVVAMAGSAGAGVAYDTISNFNPLATQVFTAVPQHGDDTTLNPAFGLTIDSVELLCRHRSGSTIETFDGTLTMRLFSSVTPVGSSIAVPGTMFYEAVLPVSIPRGTDVLMNFNVPEVVAPGASIWTLWFFTRSVGAGIPNYNDVWVRQTDALPMPGSTSQRIVATNDSSVVNPNYTFGSDNRQYAVRISTVPGPGVWAIFAALPVHALHRRRRTGI